MRCFSFLVFINIIFVASAFKILALLPLPAKSHYNIGNSVVNSLLDAGHEVTVIQPFKSKGPVPNRTDVFVEEMESFMDEIQAQIDPFTLGKNGPIMEQLTIYFFGKESVDRTLSNKKVQQILNSKEKFDAILYEIFATDVLAGLGQHFNCPVIGYTTFGTTKWANEITGNPSGLSYISNPFLGITAKMNFYQRVKNVLFSFLEHILVHFAYFPAQRELYSKYFPNSKSNFDNDLKKVSLVFLNDHFTQSSVKHYLPNMIEISGVHVQKQKQLPKDWQTYLDNSKDGVILFSMGSIIQSKDWAVEKRDGLVKAFSKLKQNVIWKYENETLPDQPKNVKIGSWLPQRDILGHPNVKLFITHGGLLGTTEALVVGVPVLGIPIYGDQKMNIARAIEAGYGQVVHYDVVNEENISRALNEMLNNPKYYETAKKISKRFNDRPLTPQESVVYWTEYVINHQGAPHLRSPGNDLSTIQFQLIDVYAFIFLTLALIVTVVYYLIKTCVRKLCYKPKSEKKIKKK